jgi:serine/threonine protein phosphatase PrpC
VVKPSEAEVAALVAQRIDSEQLVTLEQAHLAVARQTAHATALGRLSETQIELCQSILAYPAIAQSDSEKGEIAWGEVVDRWTLQGQIAPLKPLTPEQLAASAMQATGFLARSQAAAQAAVDAWINHFKASDWVPRAPVRFLEEAMAAAHQAVADLGKGMAVEERPRTTGVLALVTLNGMRWIHVGDSRAYLFRETRIRRRSRDHSVVDELLLSGQIDRAQAAEHPLRHFVEACLGGEQDTPSFRLQRRIRLRESDILLLCTDGFWGPLDMKGVAGALNAAGNLDAALDALAREAEEIAAPNSDNISAVAVRWHGR